MKKILLAIAVALFAFPAFATTSTINPNVPAPNSPLSSAVVRNNFGAAYNDVNALWAAIPSAGITWPTSGDVLTSNGTSSPPGIAPVNGECLIGSGGAWVAGSCSTGGVSSWSGDGSLFTNSGSTGAVTATLGTQSANTIFAGPQTGLAAAPTFRGLVGADLPNPSATTLGGIESLVAASHKWINTISTAGVPSATQPACGDLSNAAASCSTDATNASNITSGTIGSSEVSGSYTNITGVGTITVGTWHGTAIANTYLANSATTVNGQTCTLGSTCTVTAAASGITVGTTTIGGGTNGSLEYNNLGVFGEIAPASLTAGKATVLATARNINGVSFDGSASITVPAAFSTLTGTAAQGDILYYTGTAWAALAPGTSGYFLETQGAGANPVWAANAGGVTWPTSGDLVISNGTSSPAGVAPVNGDCLIGSAGSWVAGSCSGGTVVNSFTGDGTILSNSLSTGAVTATLANAAAGTILGNATSLAAAPTYTSTPQLGKAGTLGSITMGNATSGLLTLEPVTGALGTVTLSLPAATDTLVGKATTDTLTNKTISGSSNTLSSIGNSSLTNSSMTLAGHSVSLGGTQAFACGDLSNGATGCSTATGTSGATIPLLNGANTWSGVQTITNSDWKLLGSSTGATTFTSDNSSVTNYTMHIPAANDTLVDLAGSQALTNKDMSGAGNTWPTFNQNTTGTAANITATSNTTLTSLSNLVTVGTIGTGTWQGTAVAATYGGTGQDTHLSTGVAQVSSGTWSVSAALANGTTATTQTANSNDTKVATDAYVDRSNLKARNVIVGFDGGGSALTAGKIVYLANSPCTGTIASVTMLADQSGSAVVDVWKVAYASAPPTVANTIDASDLPTLSSAQKSTDSTLTGWTTSVTDGDTWAFKLNSASTITELSLVIRINCT